MNRSPSVSKYKIIARNIIGYKEHMYLNGVNLLSKEVLL